MRRVAAVALAVLCLAGTAVAVDEAGNRRAAEQDAAQALTLLRLPDGAVRADENPAADPQLLENPGLGASSSPNAVDQPEFWRVPGNPWDVFAWIKAHPPADGRIVVEGGGGNVVGGRTTWSVAFERRPVWNVMDNRRLAVTVVKAAGGGTALRADGAARWLVPRPVSERIPAGAHMLQIAIRGRFATHVIRLAVRDNGRIRLVARILNRLPLVQPGVFMCPMDRGIRADMTFRERAGGQVLARAVAALDGCASAKLTIGGQPQPELSAFGILDDLQAALGRRIDLTPLIGREFTQPPMPVARIADGKTIGGVHFDAVAYNGGPRTGVCVELVLAGVTRGLGCLPHPRGKRTSTFSAPACYPRALTGVGVLGRDAATARVHFDDGDTLRPTPHYLPRATLTTTIGLQGDTIVALRRPAKISLGYRGPFALGFRRGVHDLDTGFGAFARC